MTNLQSVTIAQLRKVVAIKEEIERLEAQLANVGGGRRRGRPPGIKAAPVVRRRGRPPGITAAPVVRRRRRKMSAEAKARIGAAQRARWARVKRNKL